MTAAGSKKGKAERKASRKADRQGPDSGTAAARLPPTVEELERVGALVIDG